MQDIIHLSVSDAEIAELFEGVTAGSKVRLTLDVTVSEIDDERFAATIDEIDDDVDILDEDKEELEDEEDYEDDDDGDDEEEPEEDEEEI